MENILFIVNPIAGGGRAEGYIPIIKKTMEQNNKNYNIINTNAPRDPHEALDLLVKGKFKEIDIAYVNDRIFLNIASIGLDSEIVKNAETIKKKTKGEIAYLISLFRTLFIYRNKKIKVQIDDESFDEDIMLLAVANGKYYGGGLKICPDAAMEDGYFHICIIKKASKLKIFLLFPTIFKGFHTKFKKYVEIHKAKTIKIITDEDIYLNIDGEIYDISEETMFTIGDKRLNVVC